jgi:transposase
MWTEITRRKYERGGQRYASDLTDGEWALIEPHMPAAKSLGRPREIELRAVLDAILYIARTGCQWRMLPKDFPPFTTVQGYFYGWRDNGLFETINFKRAKQRVAKRAHRLGSSTVNRSRRPRAAGRVVMMRPRRSRAASDTL